MDIRTELYIGLKLNIEPCFIPQQTHANFDNVMILNLDRTLPQLITFHDKTAWSEPGTCTMS